MPFVTGGYPSLAVTAEVIPALEQAGASIVEIGIPFSDPIADGPVIAGSMHEALQAGVTPRAVFDAVAGVRDRTSIGIVAMVSDSIITRMGEERFIREAAAAGFDGLIVPDLDLDAGPPLAELAAEHGLIVSMLVAPTTGPRRLEALLRLCSGFVYLLARAGVTGEREAMPQIEPQVQAIRNLTDLPIAVGFGISRPEHVAAVTEIADAAIVGSALVRRMGEADDPVAEAKRFVRELAGGLRGRAALHERAGN